MARSLYVMLATPYLAAAIVTAQAPAGDKPASTPATQEPAGQALQPPSSPKAGNRITYVGCVKPGTSTGTWMLENAEAQEVGATASGAVGTSGRSTRTLNLDPAATVNLKAHVNHKVEIVGMLSSASGATAAAGAKATAEAKGGEAAAGVTGPTTATGEAATPGAGGGMGTGGTGAVGARSSGAHFSVESVKMVSVTCP